MLCALSVLWCFGLCNGVLCKTGEGVPLCCSERRLLVMYQFKVRACMYVIVIPWLRG